MVKIGAHVSVSKGYLRNIREYQDKCGANSFQLFVKNPRQFVLKQIDPVEAEEVKAYVKQHNLFLVAHCSYLLNFAKDLSDKQIYLDNLINDLQNIDKLGGLGVVMHIGKYLELSQKEAIKYIVHNLSYVLDQTKELNNFIILENTAGQGTEVGFKFEELGDIYKALKKNKRIKFCLDTAHAFAAGYDLRTKKSMDQTWFEFDKYIGLDNLVMIHFNDSKKDLGTRVDRHEQVGKGLIGEKGLKLIAKWAGKKEIPIVLETPGTDEQRISEIKKIQRWV